MYISWTLEALVAHFSRVCCLPASIKQMVLFVNVNFSSRTQTKISFKHLLFAISIFSSFKHSADKSFQCCHNKSDRMAHRPPPPHSLTFFFQPSPPRMKFNHCKVNSQFLEETSPLKNQTIIYLFIYLFVIQFTSYRTKLICAFLWVEETVRDGRNSDKWVKSWARSEMPPKIIIRWNKTVLFSSRRNEKKWKPILFRLKIFFGLVGDLDALRLSRHPGKFRKVTFRETDSVLVFGIGRENVRSSD